MKAPRFPRRIDCWMSEQLAEATERLAEQQAITASAVVRQALQLYLASVGALPAMRPAANGKDHQQQEERHAHLA